jgi:hypothetical protein
VNERRRDIEVECLMIEFGSVHRLFTWKREVTYVVTLNVSKCSLSRDSSETILIGPVTSFIHVCVVAEAIWIESLVHCPTGLDEVQALGKSRHRRSICGIVEDLEAVSVISSHDRVKGDLGLGVDTGVDEAERLDSQRCPAQITSADTIVLLIEIVGKGGYPMPSVRLSPDAELLFVTSVTRETMYFVSSDWEEAQRQISLFQPDLHKVPHRWCSSKSVVRCRALVSGRKDTSQRSVILGHLSRQDCEGGQSFIDGSVDQGVV